MVFCAFQFCLDELLLYMQCCKVTVVKISECAFSL